MSAPLATARQRLEGFADRLPWLGPLVWVSSVLYFLAQVVVARAWRAPGYSVSRNAISDLGNTACGRYGGAYVCSPRHGLMNAAFVFLGVVMVAGSFLIHQEFVDHPRRVRRAAFAGFASLAIGGAGAILVGAFPENAPGSWHGIGATLAIGVPNLGFLALASVLPLPVWLRAYTLVSAVVSLAAFAAFAVGVHLGLGAGGMERLAAYPVTVWMIVFGAYIARDHSTDRGSGVLAPWNHDPHG